MPAQVVEQISIRARHRRRLGALALGGALALCSTSLVSARQSTTATISPSLSPNRLGARAALTYTIRYAGGEFGVPQPVRRAILRFPAGLTLQLPTLHTCAPARLRSRGAPGCSGRSRLGGGEALAEVRAGAQTLTEHLTLSAFLGPPHNLQPTVEILVQGYTPFDERVILTGTPFTGDAPYGEGLVIPIAAIPTLALEPTASIVSFSLTIGYAPGRSYGAGAIRVPRTCPAGGFPFAAEFTYADGSAAGASATLACPT